MSNRGLNKYDPYVQKLILILPIPIYHTYIHIYHPLWAVLQLGPFFVCAHTLFFSPGLQPQVFRQPGAVPKPHQSHMKPGRNWLGPPVERLEQGRQRCSFLSVLVGEPSPEQGARGHYWGTSWKSRWAKRRSKKHPSRLCPNPGVRQEQVSLCFCFRTTPQNVCLILRVSPLLRV